MKLTNFTAVSLLVLITLLVFSSALQNGFVNLDDDRYVTENPAIRSFTLPHLEMAVTSPYVGLYVPATMLSFMVDYQFWGYNPFGYHLTNILIHIVNVILVFFLLRALGCGQIASFLIAMIFAVHPVQAESVAWVSERKTLLSSTFFILSFLAYIRYSRTDSVRFYLYSFLFFVLALLSKPSVVVLPFLLLGYDYFYGQGISWKAIKDKILFFVFGGIFSLITICVHGHDIPYMSLHGGDVSSHIATMLPIFLNYAKLVFCPNVICGLYLLHVYKSILEFVPLVSLIVLVSVFVLFVYAIVKRKVFGFWILWFFVLMLPVSNIVPYIGTYNDRYLYLSLLTFPLLLYLAISFYLGSRAVLRRGFAVIAVFIILLLSMFTYYRNKIWRDSFTFWTDVLERVPNSARGHMGMSVTYWELGEYQKALEEVGRALEIKPDYSQAIRHLGVVYKDIAFLDEAIKASRRAIEIDPNDGAAYANLAACYARKGMTEDAIIAYEKSIEVGFAHDKEYSNLSLLYVEKGWINKALVASEKAVQINPRSAHAYNVLGFVCVVNKRYKEAAKAFEKAVELDPTFKEARNNLKDLQSFRKDADST